LWGYQNGERHAGGLSLVIADLFKLGEIRCAFLCPVTPNALPVCKKLTPGGVVDESKAGVRGTPAVAKRRSVPSVSRASICRRASRNMGAGEVRRGMRCLSTKSPPS